jgi:hypothetical protein
MLLCVCVCVCVRGAFASASVHGACCPVFFRATKAHARHCGEDMKQAAPATAHLILIAAGVVIFRALEVIGRHAARQLGAAVGKAAGVCRQERNSHARARATRWRLGLRRRRLRRPLLRLRFPRLAIGREVQVLQRRRLGRLAGAGRVRRSARRNVQREVDGARSAGDVRIGRVNSSHLQLRDPRASTHAVRHIPAVRQRVSRKHPSRPHRCSVGGPALPAAAGCTRAAAPARPPT